LGDSVIVASQNSHAVYRFDESTGDMLYTFTQLTPTMGSQFGFSVLALGQDIVVGAPSADLGAQDFWCGVFVETLHGRRAYHVP
jgi:outer membrane protein assembly factor BamB